MLITQARIRQLTIVLLMLPVIGCGSGGSSGDSSLIDITEIDADRLLVDQPELEWTVCPDQRALECTSLLVPLDYSNPAGQTISIAMARRQADVPTGSRTLIMNPGGPGAGGIDPLNSFLRFGVISTSMTSSFNFISFDPRGIGESNPLNCNTDNLYTQHPYPTTFSDIQMNFDKMVGFAQDCAENNGGYAQHLGSFNVVRDIDEMRKALGLPQIDFLGYSYGTRLAALYMQTYPQNSGRFVLDGAMKPEPDVALLAQGTLLQGQANIGLLADACIGFPEVCNPDQFVADLQRQVDVLAADPMSQETSLFVQVLKFAYLQPGFEQLLIGSLSRYLETQNVVELEFLDARLGISEQAEDINGINASAFIAVMCADDATRPTVESIDELLAAFNDESDLLAETLMIDAGMCAGWPDSIDPIPQIATNQAPASLVIGGPSDAQTPLAFAQQMAAAVGGQLLRSEHIGHTTVFTPNNSCTNSAVETFLLTGNLPAFAVCEADVSPNTIAFDWREEMSRW